MFNKKHDLDDVRPGLPSVPMEPPAPAAKPLPESKGAMATIGATIRIKGELSGDEDLMVEGQVEGNLTLPKNLVKVGKDGQVHASIIARRVEVEGVVEGDVVGHEQVVLRRSGRVRGNISAPRVTLEDGCRFKGAIDMDADHQAGNIADLKTTPGQTNEDGTAKAASGNA